MRGKVIATGVALLLTWLLFVWGGCATREAETFVVGGIFSATGPQSYLGEPERNTMMMVAEQVNAQGGLKGHPLKVVIYDDAGDVTKARFNAQKLVQKDKALGIVGPGLTPTSMAVLDLTQEARVTLISCAAGSGIASPVKEREWVFQASPTDQMAVRRIYQYLKKQRLTRVAILTVSTGFGLSGKEQLLALAPQYGIEVVTQEVFGEKDTDMTSQLTKIRGTPAQAVICWGTGPAPALVAKNLKQLGLTLPLIQSHGAASKKFIELAGDAAGGIIMPADKLVVSSLLPDSDPQKAGCQQYAEEYRAKFQAPESSFGGYAFDAMNMLVAAMEQAGADRAKIRDALEHTKNFVGVSGIFNLSPQDHNGLTPDVFVMVRIRNGGFQLID